jgi:hypothetical protein
MVLASPTTLFVGGIGLILSTIGHPCNLVTFGIGVSFSLLGSIWFFYIFLHEKFGYFKWFLKLKIYQAKKLLFENEIKNKEIIKLFDEVSHGFETALKPNQKINNFIYIDFSSYPGYLTGARSYPDMSNPVLSRLFLEKFIIFLSSQEKGWKKIKRIELEKDFESNDLEDYLGESNILESILLRYLKPDRVLSIMRMWLKKTRGGL